MPSRATRSSPSTSSSTRWTSSHNSGFSPASAGTARGRKIETSGACWHRRGGERRQLFHLDQSAEWCRVRRDPIVHAGGDLTLSINSANHTTFSVGSAGSFTVTTNAGFPTATTITETGSLPSGVSFTDNGDGTATLAGTPASGTGGSYPLTIRATNSAGHVDQSFTLTVGKQSQSITFGSLPNKLYGSAPFTVSATASSNLTVSFSSDTPGVCTVSGTTVTLVAAGTCTIRASQSGNGTYLEATDVTRSFVVGYTVSNLEPPNKATFQHGSAIPVKFKLTGAGGTAIAANLATQLGCHVTVTFNGAAPVCVTYNTTTGYFQATIKTTGTKAKQTYPLTITVTAADSTLVATKTVQVTAK